MNAIVGRLHREISHFTAMPETAKLLSISYLLRSAAYPLLGIFTSAYIWRLNNDIILLVLYYIGNFIALPFLFIFNKWLLKHIRLPVLYGVGTVLTGVSALMVVFYRSTSPQAYLLYGLLYGVGNGIYWANRNFLTLRHTTSAVRSYFTGLQFSLSTITSIIVPVMAGWFIVWSHFGYEILVVVAFIILLLAGLMIQNTSFEQPLLRTTDSRPFSPIWHKVRFLSLALGSVDSAIYILPTVLILQTLGNEGVLGSISSTIAILTAGASYIFGRKYRQRRYLPIFVGMLMCFVISGVPLLWGITVFSVAWYLTVANLADSIIWIANDPVLMDMMDDEVKQSHCTHYQLIIDREWFINIGRCAGLLVFLLLALIDQTLALRVIAAATGLIALTCMLPILIKYRAIDWT